METVRVRKGKHTWFTEYEDGRITMETDWDALAREIELATKPSRITPTKARKRGKTVKEKKSGRQ